MDKISVLKFEVTKPPVFKEVRGKDWIYWGEKNDYPDYLIDLATKSARHGAILSGKINFILGKGLAYNPKGLTDEQKAITENFIKFFKDKDKERLIVQDFEYFNGQNVEENSDYDSDNDIDPEDTFVIKSKDDVMKNKRGLSNPSTSELSDTNKVKSKKVVTK